LTLHEVLVLLRHTNKGARREALDELKEVLVDGMQKGVAIGRREGEVGMVVRGILALITDEVGVVMFGISLPARYSSECLARI